MGPNARKVKFCRYGVERYRCRMGPAHGHPPGGLLTFSGNQACFLRRILDVRFWTDYVRFTPESGLNLRKRLTSGCDPNRSSAHGKDTRNHDQRDSGN